MFAVAAGISDPYGGRGAAVMDTVTARLAGPHGPVSVVPAGASGRTQIVSPFIGGWQALADFSVHHADDALELIRKEWG